MLGRGQSGKLGVPVGPFLQEITAHIARFQMLARNGAP